jgi:hypothetical protein
MKQIYKMSRKQVAEDKGSKPTQAEDQSHKPAKHIEETARLASSIEPKRILKRCARRRTNRPPRRC